MAKKCKTGRQGAGQNPDIKTGVLFRFPKKAQLRNRWIRGLRKVKWKPTDNSRLV